MGMPDNSKWTAEILGVDLWTNGEDSHDVAALYRHVDSGHAVEHAVSFRLMGEVLVNGERPDYAIDNFVVDVDDNYARAVSEAGEDDTVTRSYWVYPESEIFEPIDQNGDLIGNGDDLPSEVLDGWRNLDYSGPFETDDKTLGDEIEQVMRGYMDGVSDAVLYTTDLDLVFSDLTAA